MLRFLYLSAFVILSAIAGVFYYSQTRLVPVAVAANTLKVGAQVEESDVTIRRVNPASVPTGILTRTDQAVGRFVSFPVLQGQFIDARQLASTHNAELLQGGLNVPKGFRIISLPVVPAAAVGGVLRAGDLVDVIAVPNTTKSVSGPEEPGVPNVIGRRVLVLGLRTEQGIELEQKNTSKGITFASNKANSILLAIPAIDETRYSTAIATSTFFFALATD